VLRRPLREAALATVVALLACRGGRLGPPPERFVPADARAAVIVPESGKAARELADLHATLSGFPGASEIAGARGALAAQLGFDPLDPEALADAGVDPRRGAAIASLDRPASPRNEAENPVLVVLAARDVPKLEALLVRLARDRLGATQRAAEVHGSTSVVVLRRPGSPSPALAYAVVERTAILCTGAAGPAAVAEAAALAPERALSESGAWKTARSAVGDAAAILFLAPESPHVRGHRAVKDGIALAVSGGPGRLRARGAVLLGAREPSFRALAADGSGAALVARLDPEAPIAARWDGDFAALGRKLAPMVPARERERLAAKGIDLERDVFGALTPGGAVALSLAPQLDLAGLTFASVRADPLRLVELDAVLPVRSTANAAATSERLARALDRRRGRVRRDDGVVRITTPSGEIGWTVDRDRGRIVVAGGRPGRLEALLARLGGSGPGWKPPTEAAAKALSGGLGGAVVDAPRLVAAVRALPDEAFGTGPTGFVMRSVVDRIVDPASRLVSVSLRADLTGGALVLSLDVEARTASEAPR
jgi:hypothetical protein